MRKSNDYASFGPLFATTAALISPTHEVITRKPLYGAIPPLEIRSTARSAIRRLAAGIDRWRRRAAQRRSLGRLDDRMLRDIGLDRQDVADEVNKPFWRP